MAAWACGDACAKGRADEQAVYALRTLSNAAPRGFAAREASDVAWALAAARERLLPPAATDNATVADVAAFLDRLAADERIPLSRDDLQAVFESGQTNTGAARSQVDAFAEAVAELSERHPDAAAYSPGDIL